MILNQSAFASGFNPLLSSITEKCADDELIVNKLSKDDFK